MTLPIIQRSFNLCALLAHRANQVRSPGTFATTTAPDYLARRSASATSNGVLMADDITRPLPAAQFNHAAHTLWRGTHWPDPARQSGRIDSAELPSLAAALRHRSGGPLPGLNSWTYRGGLAPDLSARLFTRHWCVACLSAQPSHPALQRHRPRRPDYPACGRCTFTGQSRPSRSSRPLPSHWSIESL